MSEGQAPRYRLEASNVPGSLTEAFRWQTRGGFPESDRQLMRQLVTEGSLKTVGFSLAPPGNQEPWYFDHDGIFYEISFARAGEVQREHWILWLDLIEGEPPADSEVYESSLGVGGGTDLQEAFELSAMDARIIEDASGEVYREGNLKDLEDAPPGRRGNVFVRRTHEETELLPEPPITHVAFDTGDRTVYARVVTEQAKVSIRQYEYTATPVANSADEYQVYVRESRLRATFQAQALPEKQREILERITAGGGRYSERKPLSDPMRQVLRRLDLSEVETPEPKMTSFSEDAYFSFSGSFYSAQLQIFR